MTRTETAEYVQRALREQADSAKAEGMAAYMYGRRWRRIYNEKSEMPFYGVQKPGRAKILRHIRTEYFPTSHEEYQDLVTALWELPHREEKYLAQAVAGAFRDFIVPKSLPLYRRFVVEGAWWDFVDESATHLVRPLVIGYPDEIWPEVDSWIDHDGLWLRRAAIICQVGAKEQTDADRLFRYCEKQAHEKEFFIRKAIGWALRDYAKTEPEAVARFVSEHREELSGLSYREATKHIGELVR